MAAQQLRKMTSHRDVNQKAGDGSLQVGGDLVNHGSINVQRLPQDVPRELIHLYFSSYAWMIMFVVVTVFIASEILWGDLREVAERSLFLALVYASPIFMLEIAWFSAERRLNAYFKKKDRGDS